MKLSIIIPCYNEERTIESILRRVDMVILPNGWEKEIIIVDDGSDDRTRTLLERYSQRYKIHFKANEGKGSAIKMALRDVTGDYVLIQDADLEYFPEDYPSLLEPILQGRSEIVFGSRLLGSNNVPFSALFFYGGVLVSRCFNLIFRTRFSEITCCYKIFPARLIPRLLFLPSNDFAYDAIELTYALSQSGKITEVPVRYVARMNKEGKKLKWHHGFKCLLSMLRIFFRVDQLIRKLRYREVILKVKNSTVLDIGCGPDSHFLNLCRSRIQAGYGIDKKIQNRSIGNLRFFCCDLDSVSREEIPQITVNQIFALAVLEHMQHPKRNLEILFSMLETDGEIYLTTPTRIAKPILELLAFNLRLIDEEEIRDHEHYFSRNELIKLFQDVGFVNVKHKYFELGLNHLIQATKR